MGYTTDFSGSIGVVPPLNAEEVEFLEAFSRSRRMERSQGPYYVEDNEDEVTDNNRPSTGQPGLWCQWIPTEDGTEIVWDGGEKFYDSAQWMEYIIEHFLEPNCRAKSELPFLQANHVCNGEINAYGEDPDDRWVLRVSGNLVSTADCVAVLSVRRHVAPRRTVMASTRTPTSTRFSRCASHAK